MTLDSAGGGGGACWLHTTRCLHQAYELGKQAACARRHIIHAAAAATATAVAASIGPKPLVQFAGHVSVRLQMGAAQEAGGKHAAQQLSGALLQRVLLLPQLGGLVHALFVL